MKTCFTVITHLLNRVVEIIKILSVIPFHDNISFEKHLECKNPVTGPVFLGDTTKVGSLKDNYFV